MLLGCDSAKAIYTDDNRNAATDITLEECRITLLATNNTVSTTVITLRMQGLLKQLISHRNFMSGDFKCEVCICLLYHLKLLSRLHLLRITD
jgi:hypothetical protein